MTQGAVAKLLGAVFGKEAVKNTAFAGVGMRESARLGNAEKLAGLAVREKLGVASPTKHL